MTWYRGARLVSSERSTAGASLVFVAIGGHPNRSGTGDETRPGETRRSPGPLARSRAPCARVLRPSAREPRIGSGDPKLVDRPHLELPDPLPRDVQDLSDLFQRA